METPAEQPPRAASAPQLAARSSLSRLNALSAQFASEPEMILAYIEPLAADSPELPLIWAAAEQALRIRPDYADLKYFAAHAALQVGNPHRARELLEQAMRLNPEYNAALILAGRIGLQQHEYAAALSNLQQALAAGADFADVHLMLGDAWHAGGDLARAAKAYQQALCKNPNLVEARQKLDALSASRMGEPA